MVNPNERNLQQSGQVSNYPPYGIEVCGMRISEKKHSDLYKSISNPVMEARVKICMGESIESIDKMLFDLETEIYKNVAKTLNLTKS